MDLFWSNWILCFICIVHHVTAEDKKTVFGKLVAVENPNAKKSIQQLGRNQVFATRSIAFMKKDGDVFKIHRPGLLGKKDTISFESVRLPGFYLRQKNKKVHLDNLKSRYITKDATFLESKDAVGQTLRLFMHTDQFLCHEQGHGFSLFMLKDSPKRDTLNCAFNIVETAPKDSIKSALKQAKETKPKAVTAPKKLSKDAQLSKQAKQKSVAKGAKPLSMYVQDKTTGQKIPEFKDLVDAIKQQKDPFGQQQQGSLIAVVGPAKPVKPVPNKSAKQKAAQRKDAQQKKKLPALKKPVAQKVMKDAKKDNKKLDKAAKLAKVKPVTDKAQRKSTANASPQPVNDMDKATLTAQKKHWFTGSPTKKVIISNPYMQNLQRQQATARMQMLAKKQALVKQQAYAKQQFYAKQALAKQQLAMKRFQFAKQQYPYDLQPQLPRQENPSGRQIITSLFPQTVPQLRATNVVTPTLQYVPPSQWSNVMNAESHGWVHDAKDLLNNHQMSTANTVATVATNTYATDNLLTKLHPELDLLHNAHHDVNEVISSDPNIHHVDIQHGSQYRPTPVHVTTLPHQAALHAGLVADTASEPVGIVQHINLPSAVPIHEHDTSVHVAHAAPLVVALPRPSVVTSNVIAAGELVHTDPDITLEEAFHKMEPMSVHPIEIASDSLHHYETLHHNGLQPDKAFHMRTHYVTGKPVDMNDDDENTLKEVHVVHHNHHLVHAANEDEKQKFVSTLVDSINDLCISLLFENELGDRYRLVSTLNPHGYRPKGKKFSLKTIFKEPKKRKVMSFKAYDEEDAHRLVLLNGHKELNIYPVNCANDPVKVVVDSAMKKTTLVTGSKKNEVLGKKREAESCTKVTGGTSTPGSCCVFPFVFKGQSYSNCLPFEDGKSRTWCSLTSDFDRERRWGMCSMPNLAVLQEQPEEEQNADSCPPTCTNECGNNCPISCCTDASSSSLLH